MSPKAAPTTTRRSVLNISCPFHDGFATLDALLAELNRRDTALFDAALDLRLAATERDATACVRHLLRIRALLNSRHYLAFYRVRCWARKTLRVEVRAQRGTDWVAYPFPLDAGRWDEVVNNALAVLAVDGVIPASAHVRFSFAPPAAANVVAS